MRGTMYKYWCFEDAAPVFLPSIGAVVEMLKDADEGSIIRIEVVKMSLEEYSNLPEWEGP